MIELVDTLPDTNVQPGEYKRLLGYPRERVLSGRARELADWARAWYAKNGKPWVYARQTDDVRVTNGSVHIAGESFASKPLQKTLVDAEASGVFLAAVSAGPELEAEAQRLWREEKPDEYFFLEIFGSAVVEHLVTTLGARLCAWGESHALAVLPHYSPGYPEWDIREQPKLLQLVRHTQDGRPLPGVLDVLDSGMLKPKKSLLAVFGLTPHVDRVRKLTDLVPCNNCSFTPCQYRRAPYGRSALVPTEVESETGQSIESAEDEVEVTAKAPLDANAKYLTSARALRRWADERLKLTPNDDGSLDAAFHYEGTTCSNTGRAIHFDYRVKLGPRAEGYVVREMHCDPSASDDGYRYMCRYMNNAEHLMVAIEQEKPLLGQKLNDVLAWQRPAMGAGCYCEPGSRKHKWGIVLETIHYALSRREKNSASASTTIIQEANAT